MDQLLKIYVVGKIAEPLWYRPAGQGDLFSAELESTILPQKGHLALIPIKSQDKLGIIWEKGAPIKNLPLNPFVVCLMCQKQLKRWI